MRSEVPSGWSKTTLGSVTKLVMGQSPPSSLCNENGHGLPFYQGNADFGFRNPAPSKWIEEEFKIAEKGDVLVSVRAPVGEVNVAAERCIIGRGLAAIRGTKADPDFTYFLMQERSGFLEALGQGSTFYAINSADLRELRISLPPLPEQKKIAAILSSVDEAIQATRVVIEQTRRVKEGLLQDLLTRGIGHTRFRQTEIGEIPEEWDVVDLQGVCREKVTYGIVQCGPNIENGVPYIRVSDMNSPELDVEGMLRTSAAIAARFARSTVEDGDVVYALRGSIGEVRMVGPSVAGANLTQGTARISPSGRIRSAFLLWALRGPQCVRQADLVAKGSTFREITLAQLRRIKLPVPSLHEQDVIVQHADSADSIERSCSEELAALQQVKAGLLQDLLTGKARVSV